MADKDLDAEKFARLPKWAQSEITNRRQEVVDLKHEIGARFGKEKTNVFFETDCMASDNGRRYLLSAEKRGVDNCIKRGGVPVFSSWDGWLKDCK